MIALAAVRRMLHSVKSWAGYAWFMTLGAFVPLPIFLGGYALHVTFVGAPLARRMYLAGVFVSTLGQPPPAADKLKNRGDKSGKKPFAERIRPYTPPALIERRGRPVPVPVRVIWFVLVGWWLGAIWVIVAWSFMLLPYPLPDAIRNVLGQLPSVMTLARPESVPPRASPGGLSAAR